MVRTHRDGKIDSRSARSRLRPNREPYWSTLAPGEAMGYYRIASGAGTWWARVRLEDRRYLKKSIGTADDFVDADGQEVMTYAQAQAKAREWFGVARSAAGEDARQTGPYTVADAMEDYWRDCERRGVKRVDRMTCGARLHILPELGSVEVERLSQGRIERWHLALAEAAPHVRTRRFAKKPALGPKPKTEEQRRKRKATANRILTILKGALNHAKHKRRVTCSADAWREVRPFAQADAARVRYLNLEEQARLVNGCEPDFRRLVQAGLFTGARYGELTKLRLEDFDPVNESVFIQPGKSGKGRHVFLTDEGVAYFREVTAGLRGGDLLFTHEAFLDMRRVEPETQTPVAKRHRDWKASDQKRPMKAACEAAGIEPLGFHQLRHSYASALVNSGIPLAFVAQMLGHSDTRMVERHYGHLAPSAVKATLRQLAPVLGIHKSGNVESLAIKTKVNAG